MLLNEKIGFLSTPNLNLVTYALMIEDERQYRIAEAQGKGSTVVFDPDAELRARYAANGKDFQGELRRVRLVW